MLGVALRNGYLRNDVIGVKGGNWHTFDVGRGVEREAVGMNG